MCHSIVPPSSQEPLVIPNQEPYAILYGVGPVADHVRNVFPSEIDGIDIRINSAALEVPMNGRPLQTVEGLDLDAILSKLKEHKIKRVIFCGNLHSAGTFLHLGSHYIGEAFRTLRSGDLSGFQLSAARIFTLITRKLETAGMSTASILTFDDSIRVKPGYNGSEKFGLNLDLISRIHFRKIRTHSVWPTQAFLATEKDILTRERFSTNKMISNFTPPDSSQDVFFFKFPLKGCDPAIDHPVIGEETIRLLIEKRIKGIIVDPNSTICMQRDDVIRLCDENKMFLYGITQPLEGLRVVSVVP
jgi:hypothetical protein